MFKYNDKVKVKNPNLKTYNMIGVVSSAGHSGCNVTLDNGTCFYYQNRNLEYYFYNEFISEFIDKKIVD